MRDKPALFLLLYCGLATLMNMAMYVLGEGRPDVYVSLNILVYYVSYALVSPYSESPKLLRVLNIVLFVLFSALVAYRIYMVIVGA